MYFIRLLVLNGLKFNRWVTAIYVMGSCNGPADALSHGQLDRFHCLAPNMAPLPHKINETIWPETKVWYVT